MFDIAKSAEDEREAGEGEGAQQQPAGKTRSRTRDMPPEVIGTTRRNLALDLNVQGTAPVSVVPKTPQDFVLQAQTYLMAMNPSVDDPRHGFHNEIL